MFANKQETSCGLDSAGAEREPPGRPAPAKPQGPSHVGQEWEGAERGQRVVVAAEAASRAGAPVPSRTRCSSPRPVRRARSAPTSGARFTRGCRPKVPREVFRRAAGRPGLRLGVQWRLNRDGPGGVFQACFLPEPLRGRALWSGPWRRCWRPSRRWRWASSGCGGDAKVPARGSGAGRGVRPVLDPGPRDASSQDAAREGGLERAGGAHSASPLPFSLQKS